MRVSEAFVSNETETRLPSREPEPAPLPDKYPPLGKPAPPRTALLDPRTAEGLELAAKDVKELCRVATDKPLRTQEEAGFVNRALERATQVVRQLELWRKEAVDPLNAKVKTINGIFKPLSESLEGRTGFIPRAKRLLAAFVEQEAARVSREEELARKAREEAALREAEAVARAQTAATPQERQEAMAQAEEASIAQSQALISSPEEAVKAFQGDFGKTSFRATWQFEVVKPELVPAEYRVVDEKLIRKAVLAGAREIPGVHIYESKEAVVRL